MLETAYEFPSFVLDVILKQAPSPTPAIDALRLFAQERPTVIPESFPVIPSRIVIAAVASLLISVISSIFAENSQSPVKSPLYKSWNLSANELAPSP